MKQLFFFICLSITTLSLQAQLYFPPNNSDVWDTIQPASLEWCPEKIDSLYQFLDSNNTKAFILLKDGKIVLEQYFNGHDESSNWYWASAGKTLTALMVGIAQQENFLTISDTTSTYLGQGWTNCTADQEEKITIWNQLTMTAGLDDGLDADCTIDTCLLYLADPGTRWAYHNGPYTLLDQVIENAVGLTLNQYTTLKVKNPIGMNGLYLPQGFNNVFFSTARSMARYSLLILNNGNWNGNQILTDLTYFDQMVNTSQNLNESYGYLWWLNGKNSFRLPQTQLEFPGSLNPSAPDDMIAALGKNGQYINIIPSQNMVWIRMGEAPDDSLVPFFFNDDIWAYINELECNPVNVDDQQINDAVWRTSPNPSNGIVDVSIDLPIEEPFELQLYNAIGQSIMHRTYNTRSLNTSFDWRELGSGVYYLRLTVAGQDFSKKILLR